ncbi:hypothetical protein PT974_11619 [Cladobotryum mycophilum]|uniref:CsbD-like domain-containing protein n=1 Tax=Cladobotryum mycophilum TaxID=491253 RepID=A0ABR0S5P8_9HYPO
MSSNTNTNDQPSTVKSYLDSATGVIQSAVGSLTGNSGDQAQGEVRKNQAEAEYDASHATAKVPGGTLSGSGAFAKDDSRRTEGSWDQTLGSAKEAVGGFIGNESLKQTGRQQNLEGQQKEAKGQLSDYSSGIGQRVQGTLGETFAGVTGDKEGQAHYNQMHAEGKSQQRGAEHDIQKQAEGQQ